MRRGVLADGGEHFRVENVVIALRQDFARPGVQRLRILPPFRPRVGEDEHLFRGHALGAIVQRGREVRLPLVHAIARR